MRKFNWNDSYELEFQDHLFTHDNTVSGDHIIDVKATQIHNEPNSIVFEGTVKWDGCNDLKFGETGYTHICSVKNFSKFMDFFGDAQVRYFESDNFCWECLNCNKPHDREAQEFWDYVWGDDPAFCKECLEKFKKKD